MAPIFSKAKLCLGGQKKKVYLNLTTIIMTIRNIVI